MSAETMESERESGLDHLSVCEYQLRMTFEFVQMADRKARFLMRIGLGLLGATFIGLPPTMNVLGDSLEDGGGALVAFGAVVLMYGVCVACLLMAMSKVISVVRPRIVNADEQRAPSPFFFQSIASMPIDQYKRMMRQLKPEQAVDELTTMIYHNSLVADAKFRKLDEAVRWMLRGGLVGFVFALLVVITIGLV